MTPDSNVVQARGWGMGAGWRGAKTRKMGDVCNSVNNKNNNKYFKDNNKFTLQQYNLFFFLASYVS